MEEEAKGTANPYDHFILAAKTPSFVYLDYQYGKWLLLQAQRMLNGESVDTESEFDQRHISLALDAMSMLQAKVRYLEDKCAALETERMSLLNSISQLHDEIRLRICQERSLRMHVSQMEDVLEENWEAWCSADKRHAELTDKHSRAQFMLKEHDAMFTDMQSQIKEQAEDIAVLCEALSVICDTADAYHLEHPKFIDIVNMVSYAMNRTKKSMEVPNESSVGQ